MAEVAPRRPRKTRPRRSTEPDGSHIKVELEGVLALDLVNTVACERCRNDDGLADSSSASKWIAAHPQFVPVLRRTLPIKELRELRDAIRRIFAAVSIGHPPDTRAIDCLNTWSQSAPRHRELSWEGRSMKVDDVTTADPRVSLLASVARSGMDLAGSSSRYRVRLCQAPGCLHFLVSKNSAQLWCSPTGCGNRVRVSRHYLRNREATNRPHS